MGQPQTVQGTGHWYLVARHGDTVMRVRPRVSLGETATGQLSFDASCAQLELDIDDDGGLVLCAVGGHELEWAGGARCHREHLARDRGAEIRLPHNVLLLDTAFVEEIAAPRPSRQITEPQLARFPEVSLDQPADVQIADRPPRSLGPDNPVGEGSADLPAEATRVPNRRTLSPLMVALVALSGLGLFTLLFPVFREGGAPAPAATLGVEPAPQTTSAQAPSPIAASPGRGADVPTSVASLPQMPLLPPAQDALPAIKPKRTEKVAAPDERLSKPEPVAAPAIEPVTRMPEERPSLSQAVQTTRTDEPVAVPKTIAPKPVATAAPAPVKQSDEATGAQAAEQARRRALFAADEALAQGRLTAPPDANALALYNRVLALDPGSQEARNGLQSVREGLINRAMAQLAGNALEDARGSLEAAADAGADPMLVANLQSEVAYRQQQTEARSGP